MQFSPTLCDSPNTKFTEGLATRLLCLMVEGNTLTEACREIGVSRFQVWRCRQADKEFDCAYESAHRAMAAALVDASLTELKNADRETWQKDSCPSYTAINRLKRKLHNQLVDREIDKR